MEEQPEIDETDEDEVDDCCDDRIIQDADREIGEYFRKDWANTLTARNSVQVNNHSLQALSYLAAKYLLIEPRDDPPRICYSMAAELPLVEVRQLLTLLGGENVKEVDLFEPSKMTKTRNLNRTVPEMKEMFRLLVESNRIIHKYSAVLSMNSSARYLAALAIAKREGDTYFSCKGLVGKDILSKFKEVCVPSLEEIVDVAVEHEIRDTIPVCNELNNVVDRYTEAWEKWRY